MPDTDNGRNSAPIRRSSDPPIIGFPHQPGIPPIATLRLPGHHTHAGAHTHDFLILFYAHQATGQVHIDDQPWELHDGDLFILAPGQIVAFDHPTVTGWIARFPADAIRTDGPWRTHPLLFPFARGADRAQRLHIPEPDRNTWNDLFDNLDKELQQRHDGYPQAAQAHLTLLLVAAARLTTDVAGQLRSAHEPLLATVFDIIETRYPTALTLADVATAVSLTPGHLTTVVRRRTGRTVQQWITHRRLQQARHLLTTTDLPITTIAHRTGYPDTSYFIKRFRTAFATTPAQWRLTPAPAHTPPPATGMDISPP